MSYGFSRIGMDTSSQSCFLDFHIFSLSALESPECGANSRVVDVDGVPVCECIEGYEGNETVCTGLFVDIVEQIGSTSSKK